MRNDLPGKSPAVALEPIAVDENEIARLLSVSPRTLRSPEWEKCPSVKIGGRKLFSPKLVRQWFEGLMEASESTPVET